MPPPGVPSPPPSSAITTHVFCKRCCSTILEYPPFAAFDTHLLEVSTHLLRNAELLVGRNHKDLDAGVVSLDLGCLAPNSSIILRIVYNNAKCLRRGCSSSTRFSR